MPFYAIVFKKDFEPGDHWDPRAKVDDPDRRQHWKKGELWSTGSVVADPLPFHLEKIEIPGPPTQGQRWDVQKRTFVKDEDETQRLIDAHQAEIDVRMAEIVRLSALR